MIQKYNIVYKCPLCGRLLYSPNSMNLEYDSLPDLLADVVKNQQFSGHPILYKAPFYIPCKCGNGNAGLAQFAGFYQSDSLNNSYVTSNNKAYKGIIKKIRRKI